MVFFKDSSIASKRLAERLRIKLYNKKMQETRDSNSTIYNINMKRLEEIKKNKKEENVVARLCETLPKKLSFAERVEQKRKALEILPAPVPPCRVPRCNEDAKSEGMCLRHFADKCLMVNCPYMRSISVHLSPTEYCDYHHCSLLKENINFNKEKTD